MTFYTLEYNTIEDGHYRYLYSKPENHEGYITTDDPGDAMRWNSQEEASAYLETFPYKMDFHVQGILGDQED